MYTHARTRARVLAENHAFQMYTQLHAENLREVVLNGVMQQLFVAAAATVVAWVYMSAAVRLGATLAAWHES